MPVKKAARPRKRPEHTTLTSEAVRAAINKRFGSDTMLPASDERFRVSRLTTGVLAMDYRLNGGFARGRHTELFGSPNVGKTALALCSVREAQKAGLNCAFVNVERSFDKRFARALGVDTSTLELIKHRHANQAIDISEVLLRSEIYDVLVLDSIAALVPLAELDSDMEAGSMGMEQAKLMSKALRKLTAANDRTAFIWINQVRENVGVSFGKKTRTSGGMAMGFYASTRIEMVKTETLKRQGKVIIPKSGKEAVKEVARGHRILARIEKEKAGARPGGETTFVFDNDIVGFDHIEDLMYVGRSEGLIRLTGETWYVKGYKDEKQYGKPKFRKWLSENKAVQEELEEMIRARIGPDEEAEQE